MTQQEVKNGVCASEAEKVVSFGALKPQLLVEAPKASEAVQFYKAAFGAVETARTTQPKRKADQELPHIISAQLLLGGSSIIVCDLSDGSLPAKSPGTGMALLLETDDVEAAVSKAIAAGAVAEREISEDEGACCSGRVGKVKDPYGFLWIISSPAMKSDGADVEA